jgi:NIMA (never in mitosis gene a)-related kinase
LGKGHTVQYTKQLMIVKLSNIENNIFVLKQISLESSKHIEEINKEAFILSKLSHENIVKYHDSFIESQTLNIIMEYCDAGDLSQFIQSYRDKNKIMDSDTIYKIFLQICKGIEYLHSKKVLHRDIKTMNIFMFKDGQVKIGDLGVAKSMLYNSFADTFVGTPYYLSPEICEEKPYNEKSDIWSLGCILYEMITLKKPFDGANPASVIVKIIKGKYEPIDSESNNKQLIYILDRMLEKNIKKRFNIHEILKGII